MRCAPAAVILVAALAGFAAAAYADVDVVYAGPKTWAQGWDAASFYDSSAGNRWWWDAMDQKSCGGNPSCLARVAFIKPDGSWTYSYSDSAVATATSPPIGADNYTKKPYCKNNSSLVYVARCYGTHY
jgi:hypothetical protein